MSSLQIFFKARQLGTLMTYHSCVCLNLFPMQHIQTQPEIHVFAFFSVIFLLQKCILRSLLSTFLDIFTPHTITTLHACYLCTYVSLRFIATNMLKCVVLYLLLLNKCVSSRVEQCSSLMYHFLKNKLKYCEIFHSKESVGIAFQGLFGSELM